MPRAQPDARSVKISIGVPVYNGSIGLAEALESLVDQSISDIEIIISDNASTDATPEICRQFMAKDARIKYFRQAATIPGADNFMFVLRQARAPYFMWAAHDDVRAPDFVEKLFAALTANSSAVMAFGDAIDVGADGSFAQQPALPEPGLPRWQRLRVIAFSRLHYVYGLWRTDALRSLKWPHNDWWPDLPMMMAASMLGDFVWVPGAEFKYRVKGSGRYFAVPPRPGVGGALANARVRVQRALHMARAPWLAAVSVGRVAGPGLGLIAGVMTCGKVAHSAAGYFWHWLRVELGVLPRPAP
jgi:glycosyltransferase involved in cell wall biosynthesis